MSSMIEFGLHFEKVAVDHWECISKFIDSNRESSQELYALYTAYAISNGFVSCADANTFKWSCNKIDMTKHLWNEGNRAKYEYYTDRFSTKRVRAHALFILFHLQYLKRMSIEKFNGALFCMLQVRSAVCIDLVFDHERIIKPDYDCYNVNEFDKFFSAISPDDFETMNSAERKARRFNTNDQFDVELIAKNHCFVRSFYFSTMMSDDMIAQ